jgi:hypothetical protein
VGCFIGLTCVGGVFDGWILANDEVAELGILDLEEAFWQDYFRLCSLYLIHRPLDVQVVT